MITALAFALSLVAADPAPQTDQELRRHTLNELYKSGCVELSETEFKSASPVLLDKEAKELARVGQALLDEPELRLQIVVHAEPAAAGAKPDLKADVAAMKLAGKRGEAIRMWLAKNAKISPKRLVVEPIAASASPPEGCHAARAYVVNQD
jgi:hypothetical protein